jgi:uncharacterized protein YbjT (DUF2867 family)
MLRAGLSDPGLIMGLERRNLGLTKGDTTMHVFVAGATGAVGRPLIRQLVAAGHQVTATTRTAAKVEQLRALGANPVVADGLGGAAMMRAVLAAEPDAIVHQMTALGGKPDLRRFDRWFATTNKLRTEGTDILLAAAGEAGVRRFVAQSYTGWTNPRTGGPTKTVSDPLDPEPLRMQRESLAAIRYLEQTVPAAPVGGIVLRDGNFYGPGASDPLVELVRKRRFPVVARPTDGRIRRGAVDDRGARLVEPEGKARARVGARVAELAGGLPHGTRPGRVGHRRRRSRASRMNARRRGPVARRRHTSPDFNGGMSLIGT